MTARLTIGIPAELQEKWVGGLYYVRNCIFGFKLLPARQRPAIAVIGDRPAFDYLAAETGYPGLTHVPLARLVRAPARRLDLRRAFRLKRPREIDAILFGSAPGLEDRAVQWVPDFQEERYPEFFKPGEVDRRRARNAGWFGTHRHIVVSSQAVAADLVRHYGAAEVTVHVLPFASFVDGDPLARCGETRRRYTLPERYFICSNQIMRHKNHAVILRALARLTASETPPVVMTGMEADYRNPAFAASVKELASALGVADRVRFLGFLPRENQLALIAGAIAVLQPSLFEGWSTIIEDAKALGRHVLASDIAVHREQLATNADFFGPHDDEQLAALLARYGRADPPLAPLDYAAERQRFAAGLLRLARDVEGDFRRRGVDRLVVAEAAAP